MKKLFLLLALLGMVATGCSKDEGRNIPDDAYISLNKEIVTISPDGESVDVKVYSNYAWKLTNNCDWITTSITSGDASDTGVTVTITVDISYDDRDGTIVFSCGKAKKLLVVSQKFKEAIIPDAKNTFNIPAEGGVAVISYQTSVDCEVIIPEEAQDWITIAPASRGLVSESINLDIAENTTYSARTAVIKVVAKDNAELAVEYTINQEQNDAILADENNTFTVPSAGGEVVINYQTNIDCEVIIPEEAQSWITIEPATRGVISKSITLDVTDNTTYSARTAVIKVVAKDNAELAVEYTINQEQKNALLADNNNTFNVYGVGGSVVIKYQANVDCDIIIPEEAQDWITIAPATRGLSTYSTTLNIAENNSGKERSCVIKVTSQDDNELSAEYTIIQKRRYCLYYTSNDGKIVQPNNSSAFGATIISNTYIDGVGVIDFNTPITTIGDYAFEDCSNLTSVTISESVTEIGPGAFFDCRSLTSVTIPDSVTTIEDDAFWYCSNLTSVTIPDSVTTIGSRVFLKCSSLTSVTIPDSVTTIEDDAFYGCTGELIIYSKIIETDYIDNNFPSYYDWLGGAKFTKLTIGDGIEKIGDYAFYDCDSLTSVTIPDSVTTIGDLAFSGCNSLTSVTIPDSVTTIGDEAFHWCNSLTSVTIPDSVTTIGNEAFFWCYSLTSVTIGDSVTTIGSGAFSDCDDLTSVTIGDSVTTIGWGAFRNCDSLTSVYINDIAAWCNISFGDWCSNPLNYANNLYLNNELVTDLTIPDSVTEIGDYAFYKCISLTSVTIGNSVTTIGYKAFADCNSLTSVTIPNSVTTIGVSTFAGCSSLTSVTIPGSVTTIGNQAFSSCSSLTSVYCKAITPPAVGHWVFSGNASGRKIYVPMESVEAYKSAEGWSGNKYDLVGYNF